MVLATASALLMPAVPATAAEPIKPYVSIWVDGADAAVGRGKIQMYKPKVALNIYAPSKMTPQLQKYSGGKWVNVSAKPTLQKYGKINWFGSIPLTYKKLGETIKWRVQIKGSKSVVKATSSTLTLKSARDKTWSGTTLVDSGYSDTYPTGSKVKARFWAMPAAGRTAHLERYDAKRKKWVTVSKKKLPNTADIGTVDLAVPEKPGQKYRFSVPGTSAVKGASMTTGTVKFENPRKYTGYRAKAYGYIKNYCPNVTIETSSAKAELRWFGNMNGIGYTHNSDKSTRIAVMPGLSDANLHSGATHACADLRGQRVRREVE